ncbi:MAG: 16S rRNA (guanine(527)-N(7))-methyltransferase RsmG [Pseudomonadota bacterium]
MIATESDARDYVARWGDAAAISRLERFSELLIAENQRQNLISRPSEAQIWQRHIADSAQLLEYIPRETFADGKRRVWLDLGTGAGFPGLVIAALLPNVTVKLVESRGRRVEFLQHCIDDLGLNQCTVLGERLEKITPFECRVISARAFAPLKKLLRLSAPFSTAPSTGGTIHLLPKGRSAAQELAELKPAIRKMFHVEQSLTDRDAGIIVGG